MKRKCMYYLASGYDSIEDLIDDGIASAAQYKCIVSLSFKGVGMALGEETDREFAIKNMKDAVSEQERVQDEIGRIIDTAFDRHLSRPHNPPSNFRLRHSITEAPK